MAVRKPLTLIDGVISELPAGDTVSGASGGSGTFAVKQTTINFGTIGSAGKLFTITDAAVTTTSKILADIEYDTDEAEMTPITLFCKPAVGSFNIYATPIQGPAHGTFKVNYTIG